MFLRSRAMLVGLVVGVPLSAAFLWLALRGVDLDAVGKVLATADVRLVALGVLAMACVSGGQAVRWRAIARTPSVSTARFVEMVVSAVAVNDVVPGRVGEFLRARWLALAARIPGGRAFATVFVDRVFDVVTLVIFLAVSLPFATSAEWLRRITVGGLVLLGLVALVLAGARVYARRRTRERRHENRIVRRLVRDTLEGLAEPLGRRREAALLGISLATWSMWGLAAWLVARSVGIELSVVDVIFVTAVINLGVAMPSSPGFIGTYQWLGVSVLALFDVGANQALAFAILLHAIWYVPTLLVGGTLLLRRAVLAMRVGPAVRAPLVEASDA